VSYKLVDWVMTCSGTNHRERAVLGSLARHANDDGSGAWPSISTMAREAGLSRSSVDRALRSLRATGHIKASGTHRVGTPGGPQAVPVYRVVAEAEGQAVSPQSPAPEGYVRLTHPSPKGTSGRRTRVRQADAKGTSGRRTTLSLNQSIKIRPKARDAREAGSDPVSDGDGWVASVVAHYRRLSGRQTTTAQVAALQGVHAECPRLSADGAREVMDRYVDECKRDGERPNLFSPLFFERRFKSADSRLADQGVRPILRVVHPSVRVALEQVAKHFPGGQTNEAAS
jgi:hypothetical protein